MKRNSLDEFSGGSSCTYLNDFLVKKIREGGEFTSFELLLLDELQLD